MGEETKEERKYDAKAEQTVSTTVEVDGKTFTLDHRFKPMEDSHALEYERRRDVRLSDADRDAIDEEGLAQSSDTLGAAEWLWNDRIIEVTGIEEDSDWKQLIPLEDKETAIRGLLMFETRKPKSQRAEGKLNLRTLGATTVRIEADTLFDGWPIKVAFSMNKPSAEEYRRYKKLMARVTRVRGTKTGSEDIRIDSKARGLGKLFQELKNGVEGYVDDIVPLHHQQVVASHLLGSTGEVNQKNSTGSPSE